MPQDATPENSDNAVLVKQLAAVEDKLSVAIETLRQAKVELDRKDQVQKERRPRAASGNCPCPGVHHPRNDVQPRPDGDDPR